MRAIPYSKRAEGVECSCNTSRVTGQCSIARPANIRNGWKADIGGLTDFAPVAIFGKSHSGQLGEGVPELRQKGWSDPELPLIFHGSPVFVCLDRVSCPTEITARARIVRDIAAGLDNPTVPSRSVCSDRKRQCSGTGLSGQHYDAWSGFRLAGFARHHSRRAPAQNESGQGRHAAPVVNCVSLHTADPLRRENCRGNLRPQVRESGCGPDVRFGWKADTQVGKKAKANPEDKGFRPPQGALLPSPHSSPRLEECLSHGCGSRLLPSR